jgi:hypothetical protein
VGVRKWPTEKYHAGLLQPSRTNPFVEDPGLETWASSDADRAREGVSLDDPKGALWASVSRCERGEFGGGDGAKAEAEVRRAVAAFTTMTPEERGKQGEQVPVP